MMHKGFVQNVYHRIILYLTMSVHCLLLFVIVIAVFPVRLVVFPSSLLFVSKGIQKLVVLHINVVSYLHCLSNELVKHSVLKTHRQVQLLHNLSYGQTH